MNRPCPHCPFRTDIEPFLHHGRAREIADSLRAGSTFECHATLEYGDDDEGEPARTHKTKGCAGAVITMEREGIIDQNQMARISMRLGLLDPSKLDMDAPVPKSLRAWGARHKGH